VDSYELGVKFQTSDHRFRVNAALFEAKYDGLQLPVFFPGTSNSYTSNASAATIKGIELEPTWQVSDSLRLYSSAAWTTGKYTEPFICSGANTTFRECSGNHIKGVIPHKIVSGLLFSPRLSIPGRLRFSAEWNNTGAYFNNVANEIYLVQTEAASVYNGSIAWSAASDKWGLTLDCRNITDKVYVLAGLQLASAVRPAVTGYINEPRQLTLRFKMDF
jgi:iron complex outermembrane receptor protein